MTVQKIHPLDFIGTTLLSFMLSFWAFKTFVIPYMRHINHYGLVFTMGLHSIIVLILTYTFYCFFTFCRRRQISSKTVVSLYTIYFLGLIYVLFFKNIGKQGLSLDFFSFVSDFQYSGRFVPVMNAIMFIPLGAILPKRLSTLPLAIVGILLVEGCQYVFHLGVFDLGDLTLNSLSILIGMGLALTPLAQKVKSIIR
ncbi:VanZ family protein [Streptococcus sp. DD12]|uniref:VanZ family protein n=1 Tax=Streptococcus sp. DD12 TaxID=1777880 RepID=UPI000793D591|nr:VanZ family protein [Streptococcus sp. DD12]KXT76544.1 hypothetical protein STRDD12_00424 [Streptococcus sp. DD12]